MKVFLMYPDRNMNPDLKLPWNADMLIDDLELNRITDKMANGDKFLHLQLLLAAARQSGTRR